MLGTLAGISIAFISMRPGRADVGGAVDRAAGDGDHPDRLLHRPEAAGQHPGRAGRAAGRHRDRLDRRLHVGARTWSAAAAGRRDLAADRSTSAGSVEGLADVAPLLATAIPLGIYNFTEGMTNVESAAVAGDEYNLRSILLADGAGAVVGSVLGCPFPPAVYIGHPGWKAAGGRTSLLAGVRRRHRAAVLPRPVRAARSPAAAAGDRADPALHRAADRRAGVPGDAEAHAVAVVIAIIPNIASWAAGLMDNALGRGGDDARRRSARTR